MTKTRWILVLVAAGAAYGSWRLWRFDRERSPERFLESAQERLDAIDPDYRTALRELERALALAEARGDDSIVETALRLRADVNRRNRALDNALRDYRTLLESWAPDDVDLVRNASRTALDAGHLEEAEALSSRWLELQPKNGGAFVQRGEVLLAQAEGELAALGEDLGRDLDSEQRRRAMEAIAGIVYLPEGSSLRAGPFGAYVGLRSTAQQAVELPRIEALSELVGRAREDLQRSLEASPAPRPLGGLQLLLRRAGRPDEAATLGLFAMHQDRLRRRHEVFPETAVSLYLGGRPELARAVWERGRGELEYDFAIGGLAPELCLRAVELLAAVGLYGELVEDEASIAWSVRRIGAEPPDLSFAHGMQLLAEGKQEEALASLTRIRPEDPELFPGANLTAYLALEKLLRTRPGPRVQVWQMLTRLASDVRPDDPLAPGIAAAWRSLALQARKSADPQRPQVYLGRALSLVGEDPALLADWEEIGQQAMAARGFDLPQVEASLRFDPRVVRTGSFLPYEVLGAARGLFRSGSVALAKTAVGTLREVLPDLPQALFVAGSCELALGDQEQAARLWARRVEIGGPGREHAVEALSRLPWDAIPEPVRLRLLRAAPLEYGPFVRLRNLAGSGRQAEAIAWIERRDLTTLGEAMRVEAASLYASTGQWEKVRGTLAALPLEAPATARTAGLYLRSLVRTPGGVEQAGLERVARANPDDADLVLAIDDLVAEGRLSEAEAALERLLRRGDLRLPALAERFLAIHLAQTASVAERMGELRASVEEPGARLLGLAAASDAGAPGALEQEAAELAKLPFADHPLSRALARALAGELDEAAATLDGMAGATFGAAELRRALASGLVRSLADTPGDAAFEESARSRPFLGFLTAALLTLQRPSTVPWALTRLRALPPALREDRRVALLEALALAALGADDRAEALTVQLCESGVEPAWLLREELAERRLGSASPAFARLRSQRIAAIGAEGLAPDALALHESREAAREGRPERALAVLDTALEALPETPPLLAERARLQAASPRPLRALEDYHRLLDLLPAERAGELVPEYLSLLHHAQDEGLLTAGALRSYVEALSALLPAEPLPVGELAWLAASDGRDAGLARAWELMEAYLRRSGGRLDGFRPGEARRWIELFLRVDPERAVRFAADELAAHPESPQAWSAWVSTLRAAGQDERAFRELSLFARFHPEPEVLADLPLYAADAGLTPDELAQWVERAREGLRLAAPQRTDLPDPAFVQALDAYERFEPLGPEQRSRLESAWRACSEDTPHSLRRRLTAAYAEALLESGEADARDRAREVVDALQGLARDPLDRHVDGLLPSLLPR